MRFTNFQRSFFSLPFSFASVHVTGYEKGKDRCFLNAKENFYHRAGATWTPHATDTWACPDLQFLVLRLPTPTKSQVQHSSRSNYLDKYVSLSLSRTPNQIGAQDRTEMGFSEVKVPPIKEFPRFRDHAVEA
jgi:hypothetical protein